MRILALAFIGSFLRGFLRDDSGQDLIEYTILLSFVTLASIAIVNGAGHAMKGIWMATNADLTAANHSAS
jgi:Flp pilus assembly pilin Flp